MKPLKLVQESLDNVHSSIQYFLRQSIKRKIKLTLRFIVFRIRDIPKVLLFAIKYFSIPVYIYWVHKIFDFSTIGPRLQTLRHLNLYVGLSDVQKLSVAIISIPSLFVFIYIGLVVLDSLLSRFNLTSKEKRKRLLIFVIQVSLLVMITQFFVWLSFFEPLTSYLIFFTPQAALLFLYLIDRADI